MNYVREHTNIPIPRVHYWGLTKESPQQLGPFIIMDFVEGQSLGRFLAQPTEDKAKLIFLDPNIDEVKFERAARQLHARVVMPRIPAHWCHLPGRHIWRVGCY